MYDELFDFNGDGKVDAGEEYCAYRMFEECTKDDEAPQSYTNCCTPGRHRKNSWGWIVLILFVLYAIIKVEVMG